MTPHQFAYWLQGFAELNAAPPSAEQWQSIRDHLTTVFVKVTPRVAVKPDIVDPSKAPRGWPSGPFTPYVDPNGAGNVRLPIMRSECHEAQWRPVGGGDGGTYALC